jgi:hypothetical protein
MSINAEAEKVIVSLSSLKLGSSGDDTERSTRFWNPALVAMKFSVETLWMKAVWETESKPNYGMRDLDPFLEERASNKFEVTGPLIDSFLRELGKSIYSELGRSRNTGLMSPVKLFVPYNIFRHICNVAVGYGASLKSTKSQILITIEYSNTASKVFSPIRFNAHNFLRKRHFNKIRQDGRTIFQYSGRAAVVVGKSTPLLLDCNLKQEKLTLTF